MSSGAPDVSKLCVRVAEMFDSAALSAGEPIPSVDPKDLRGPGSADSMQHDTQLDEAVFHVAATFPIPGVDRINPDPFLQQLDNRRGGMV